MKEIITESIRYWEPRRIIYNAALGLVVVAAFYYCPQPLGSLNWQPITLLLVAAVVANVLYCAAYVADVFIQMSEYRQMWKRCRWALLVTGTVFTAALFLLQL